jgi:hypothetical protein
MERTYSKPKIITESDLDRSLVYATPGNIAGGEDWCTTQGS